MHHASGSSEDSSTDDVLCPPHHHQAAVSNSNGVKFAADEETIQCCHNPDNSSSSSEVSNLIKHASISDDHLLQDRKTRQVFISTFSIMTLQHSLILRSCIFWRRKKRDKFIISAQCLKPIGKSLVFLFNIRIHFMKTQILLKIQTQVYSIFGYFSLKIQTFFFMIFNHCAKSLTCYLANELSTMRYQSLPFLFRKSFVCTRCIFAKIQLFGLFTF